MVWLTVQFRLVHAQIPGQPPRIGVAPFGQRNAKRLRHNKDQGLVKIFLSRPKHILQGLGIQYPKTPRFQSGKIGLGNFIPGPGWRVAKPTMQLA